MTRLRSVLFGIPKSSIKTEKWIAKNRHINGLIFRELFPEEVVSMAVSPYTLEPQIHALYRNEISHTQNQVFLTIIPNARVWGRCGAVITPDNYLLEDVSREFGKYKGVYGKDHSIFKQIKLVKPFKIDGRIAVIATSGSNNYHHWLYDCVSRIDLLKRAGVFEEIDFFIIDFTGIKFQRDSLKAVGISEDKIIKCNDHWNFHIEASQLIIPSLSGNLGVISDRAVQFLRKTFLPIDQVDGIQGNHKIYLSRQKAPSRKLINESSLVERLENRGFISFFPEDFTIAETAKMFSQSKVIIGVHGSGFANLAFCSPGTLIIDILAPKHLDAYYWILANHTKSIYGYLFGKGERLAEDTDLVSHKIDEDIQIDFDELFALMEKMENAIN